MISRCDNIIGKCELGCKLGWDIIICDKGNGFYVINLYYWICFLIIVYYDYYFWVDREKII